MEQTWYVDADIFDTEAFKAFIASRAAVNGDNIDLHLVYFGGDCQEIKEGEYLASPHDPVNILSADTDDSGCSYSAHFPSNRCSYTHEKGVTLVFDPKKQPPLREFLNGEFKRLFAAHVPSEHKLPDQLLPVVDLTDDYASFLQKHEQAKEQEQKNGGDGAGNSQSKQNYAPVSASKRDMAILCRMFYFDICAEIGRVKKCSSLSEHAASSPTHSELLKSGWKSKAWLVAAELKSLYPQGSDLTECAEKLADSLVSPSEVKKDKRIDFPSGVSSKKLINKEAEAAWLAALAKIEKYGLLTVGNASDWLAEFGYFLGELAKHESLVKVLGDCFQSPGQHRKLKNLAQVLRPSGRHLWLPQPWQVVGKREELPLNSRFGI